MKQNKSGAVNRYCPRLEVLEDREMMSAGVVPLSAAADDPPWAALMAMAQVINGLQGPLITRASATDLEEEAVDSISGHADAGRRGRDLFFAHLAESNALARGEE